MARPPIRQPFIPRLIELINKHRRDTDSELLKLWWRLTAAYAKLVRRIEPRIRTIEVLIEASPDITPAQIRRTTDFTSLMREITEEVGDFSKFAKVELDLATPAAVELALLHLRDIYETIGYRNIRIVAPSALEYLADYLKPGSPLLSRIELWAPNCADQVAKSILEGVKLGYNPRKVAALMRKALNVGLNDALRTSRTATMWSYRRATHASYLANSNIIENWIWYTALDDRTCMSCISMHGTVHPLTEILNDHHCGRCVALPGLAGVDYGIETGQAWFDKLSDAAKELQMGKGRYAAYKKGLFDFSQLSSIYNDPVYGDMRVETALKDIL